MSTQPVGNGSWIQEVPLKDVYAEERKQSKWQYVIDRLEAAGADNAVKLTFRSRYLAAQCAIGIRALIQSRTAALGIRHKGQQVFVWKMKG